MKRRRGSKTVICAIVIVLLIALVHETSTITDIDATRKMAEIDSMHQTHATPKMLEVGLPPHGDENDYPTASARDNMVQVATAGVSRGQVAISSRSGLDITDVLV